jgi:hypothetical protein
MKPNSVPSPYGFQTQTEESHGEKGTRRGYHFATGPSRQAADVPCNKRERGARAYEICNSALFDGLGMNRDAGDLGESLFDAILQRGGDVVDFGDGQAALHRAVA